MSALGKDPGAQWTLLLAFTVLLSFGFGVMVGTKLDVANTQTQVYHNAGWVGVVNPAYHDQMLDEADYVASWSPNLIGQRVTADGGFGGDGSWVQCNAEDLGYRFQLSIPGVGKSTVLPSGAPWDDPNGGSGRLQTVGTSGSYYLAGIRYAASIYWDIMSPDGKTVIPEGSTIHAEFWLKCQFGSWVELESDEARIHTGIGGVSWDRDPALYQVGDVASCSWNVGYVSDPATHQGWSLFMTSTAQGGATVSSVASISTLTGGVSYKVTSADWAPNTGKLYCILRNNLFDKDFVVAGTVDNATLSPSLVVTKITPQSPKQGETVTIFWTATPNPVTKSPISSIEVIYGWGGPDNDVKLPGNDTSYSFTAAQSGYVRVAVGAWDSEGRPSGFKNLEIQIDHQEAGGGLSIAGLDIGAWAILLTVLIIGVGVFFVSKDAKNPSIKLGGVVLGLVLVAASVVILAPVVVSGVVSALTPHL